jgi:hypothetical protein
MRPATDGKGRASRIGHAIPATDPNDARLTPLPGRALVSGGIATKRNAVSACGPLCGAFAIGNKPRFITGMDHIA